jgi:hypothetical protein
VITTILLLNNGGQELNKILLWLSTITSMTLNNVVIWTHIGAVIICLLSMVFIVKKNKVEMSIFYMIIGMFLVYLFVILNNIVAVIVRFIL